MISFHKSEGTPSQVEDINPELIDMDLAKIRDFMYNKFINFFNQF